MEPKRMLEGAWSDWRRGDKAATLSWFSEDVIFSMNLPPHVWPAGGLTTGKSALSDRLQWLLEAFEMLEYRAAYTGGDTEIGRGRVFIHLRHRLTGHEIETSFGIIAKLRDGLIVSWDELHDVHGVEAFMGVISATAADHRANDGAEGGDVSPP